MIQKQPSMMPMPGAPTGPPDQESFSKMSEPTANPTEAETGMKVKRISVEEADNGGFIGEATLESEGPEGGGPMGDIRKLAFGSLDEAIAYITEQFGAPAAPAGGMARGRMPMPGPAAPAPPPEEEEVV